MNDKSNSTKKGDQAAKGLREAAAKDEAKTERKMGHDMPKGADQFEERSRSSDGKGPAEKQS